MMVMTSGQDNAIGGGRDNEKTAFDIAIGFEGAAQKGLGRDSAQGGVQGINRLEEHRVKTQRRQ